MKRLLISLASSAALIFLLIGPALHSQITVSPAGGGSGGSGTPGGATTQLQYNNAGAFAGIAGLTWDGTTLTAGAIPINLGAANPLTIPAFGNVAETASTLTYAATTDIDFLGDAFKTVTLTGNITFTTSNRTAGRSVTVRIIGDGTARTLTFPAWQFIGGAAPTSLAINEKAVLTISALGTLDTDIIASYSTATSAFAAPGPIGGTTPGTGAFTTLTGTGAAPQLTLGVNTTTLGSVKLFGNTSGDATVRPAAVAGTATVVTLPNASSTLPIFGQQITFAGPTAARTITLPDAAFTVARADGITPVGIFNFAQAQQSQVVVSGTQYYITNSNLNMPAAYTTAIGAGTTMRWRLAMTKTAAGTGTFQILLKKGTNGSTADATLATATIGTQTAVLDALECDVVLTWTSATAAYWTVIPRQFAATGTGFGFVYPAAAQYLTGTISGQTTTTASDKYGLSFVATTGTPTILISECTAQAFGVN